MESRIPIGLILLLAITTLLSSSQASQSLTCYSDYIDILTCEWNVSLAEERLYPTPLTNCSLGAFTQRNSEGDPETVHGHLSPFESSQPKLHKATLHFSAKTLKYGKLYININVSCAGISEPVEWINSFNVAANVKLYPPTKPEVVGGDVSWEQNSKFPTYAFDVVYQLQFKLLEESWEKARNVPRLQAKSLLLPTEEMLLDRTYVVRVRTQNEFGNMFWSDWSPSTEWTSTVGKPSSPPSPPSDGLIPWLFPSLTGTAVVVAVAVFLLVFFRLHLNTCCPTAKRIPNPAAYFEELNSKHKGDFKQWLGSIMVLDPNMKPDAESIFPVEVTKYIPSKLDGSSGTKRNREGQVSSFSNSSYFLSQSSKCPGLDQLEPCLPESPYGPAGGNPVEECPIATEDSLSNDTDTESAMASPLETSSSYKHVQKFRLDVQSPDSGFATGGEDQDSQEECWSTGLPSPPVVVDKVPPINSILPCPIPLPGFPQMLMLPGLGWCPQDPPPFGIKTSVMDMNMNMLMANPDFLSCPGIVEPSSEDYMPVKKVQEE